ncbi:MAG: hypothetical protein E7104_07005 [Prevotella sp.]|jgi:hypothetical protein|nr:hypothetical protein [Prevotella sp.]
MVTFIKKTVALALLVLVGAAMTACSNEEQLNDSVSICNTVTHRITAEQASQNALEFVNNIKGTSRSNTNSLEVEEVKAVGVEGSRSGNDTISVDSLFYVVNFKDNNGYVIAASDDRETPIYAYIEKGKYSELDTLNKGYDAFVSALMESKINNKFDDYRYIDEERERIIYHRDEKPDTFEIMKPLLKTKWNQTTYAKYCPGDYTGCVATAFAQICSYTKQPNSIRANYNGVTYTGYMDWDRIEKECISFSGNVNSNDLINQVSGFMLYLGCLFEAKYKSGGTDIDSERAVSRMRDFGCNISGLTDYDAINVMNDLKKGNRIVYMRGNARYYHVGFVFRKYVDGHGWVVDGYIFSRKNNQESLYMHCNWGWGGYCDGYFLSDVLNTGENPYYDDYGNPNSRANYNFRYHLKTATVCK